MENDGLRRKITLLEGDLEKAEDRAENLQTQCNNATSDLEDIKRFV